MKTQQDIKKEAVTEQEVIQYLREHPDFFVTNSQLLSELKIPHKRGSAISLVERQIAVLREQKSQLNKQLQNLVQIARENDLLNQRMHRLILILLKADSLDYIIKNVQERLMEDFSVEAVAFRLFVTPSQNEQNYNQFIEKDNAIKVTFEKILRQRLPVCGPLKSSQQKYLFGPEVGDIHSVALLP